MSYLIEGIVIGLESIAAVAVLWGVAIGVLKALQKYDLLKKHGYYYRWLLLGVYIVAMLRITGIIGTKWELAGSASFNVVPFVNEEPILMVLNTLLFLPFGLLVPFAFSKMRKWKWILSVGFLVIIVIELLQMFLTGRLLDIDDFIFNSLGVVIGYTLFCFGRKLVCRLSQNEEKVYGRGSFSLFPAWMGILVGIPVKGVTIADIILYQFGINVLGGYEYRISSGIPIFLGILGLILGIGNTDDRLAKAGIASSIVSIIIGMCFIPF